MTGAVLMDQGLSATSMTGAEASEVIWIDEVQPASFHEDDLVEATVKSKPHTATAALKTSFTSFPIMRDDSVDFYADSRAVVAEAKPASMFRALVAAVAIAMEVLCGHYGGCRVTRPASRSGSALIRPHAVAVLVLLMLLPLAAPMPRFTWEHISTFAHCSNTTGSLSASTLGTFHRHSFVVLEKVQCLTCAPVNRSCEEKMYAASRQLKASNPGVEVYVYVAVDIARPMYDAYEWFNTHPAAELHDSHGKLLSHTSAYCPVCRVFDYTDDTGPTPARWNAVVTDAISKGKMDGCFVDGISSGPGFKGGLLRGATAAKQDAWLVALNSTLAALRAAVGDDTVLLQNSHSGWPQRHGARTQLGVGGKIDSKLSFSAGSLQADMQLFSETAPRVAALYQNFGQNQRGHAEYDVSLAAFLIAMGNTSYWSFTETQVFDGDTWECANWAAASGHEADYVRPLGRPLEPAMQCRAGAKLGQKDCSRTFETGTCAYVSTHGSDARSCVWWSDGAGIGDAATCADNVIRAASCKKKLLRSPAATMILKFDDDGVSGQHSPLRLTYYPGSDDDRDLDRAATTRLKYFGWYRTHFSTADFPATGPHSNLYQAVDAGADVSALAAAKAAGQDTLLAVESLFPGLHTEQPDFATKWLPMVPVLRELLANDTIIGFNLGDELVCGGMKSAVVHEYANTVRAAFPRQSDGKGAIIWCE